jgi:hypothetical protein
MPFWHMVSIVVSRQVGIPDILVNAIRRCPIPTPRALARAAAIAANPS